MMTTKGKGLTRLKGHSKSNSTDTLCSQKRTRFLSVISAATTLQNHHPSPPPPLKTVVQLKRIAMGHRSTRSVSQNCSQAFGKVDLNRPVSRFQPANGVKLRVRDIQLGQWLEYMPRGSETPINKLMFSGCKQNWFHD